MRLLVGRIGRAHGILGEATIEVRTDEPDRRFAIGALVQTDSNGELKVISGRVHNGILLLGFEGITDRNSLDRHRRRDSGFDLHLCKPGRHACAVCDRDRYVDCRHRFRCLRNP